MSYGHLYAPAEVRAFDPDSGTLFVVENDRPTRTLPGETRACRACATEIAREDYGGEVRIVGAFGRRTVAPEACDWCGEVVN